MDVIGPRETTVEVCPTCGLDVRDGEHATGSHQNDPTVEVEYVRADLHRGAVEALRRIENIVGEPTENTQPGSITAIVAEALAAIGGR